MHIRTRVAAGALAALAVAGCAAGTAAAQASPQAAPQAPGRLTFTSQLTAIRFFTASGPIPGFPTSPLKRLRLGPPSFVVLPARS
jgi:hypothetical protein